MKLATKLLYFKGVKNKNACENVTTALSTFENSRKTLHKYNKFRVKIDENDEVAYWDLICREG